MLKALRTVRNLAAVVVLAGLTGLLVAWLGTITAQPAYAATYGQELAACSTVWYFHQVDRHDYTNEAKWQAAYRAAYDAAKHADPNLHYVIDRYLFTDKGWSRVVYDCGYDTN